ncbi:MAG TPA: potassium channel family protein [Mycobacteriales bacterium]
MSARTVEPAGTPPPSAGTLRPPAPPMSPLRLLARRLLMAMALLGAAVAVVYLGRDGYRDVTGDRLSLLDALYYATVSLSTTGYGDITPVSAEARLLNVVVITPLRILFLLVLVGTTLEVLTTAARERSRASRWRKHMNGHTVVIGYGTKGRAATAALCDGGERPERILVIESDPGRAEEATRDGLAVVIGDGTRSAVLEHARTSRAARVIVACSRDETSVLATLSVRQLNRTATLVASVRRAENVPLLRSSGADTVIVSAEAAGRLLGVSAVSPATGVVVQDLISPGAGLDLVERPAGPAEDGAALSALPELVVAVVRDGGLHLYNDPAVAQVRAGDRLISVHAVAPVDRHDEDAEPRSDLHGRL